ncbi:hypothetical protein LTR36_009817 [Oleoguttula mirabilis]|uniref:Uncharacterized protein n=1 Tax=Oleoguttula mirabilis TaxID=1507867 RepID=A0AAV9J522_9PEZI|nr:hypothetical protein LTR36_009817 [Oleoguttula mirabilis]
MPNPPVVQRQTIKQAKAAFKARGRPAISDAEKKQLERSLELDRRAWRSKEQEKRKAEAVRKRQEKERKEKEVRQKAMIGTQRRCDRFGYKSSQFHLGAFFGAGAVKTVEGGQAKSADEDDDSFGDDEVDDEMLLHALESPEAVVTRQHHTRSNSVVSPTSQRTGIRVERSVIETPIILTDELSNFWDELGSSTQIARELAPDPKPKMEARAAEGRADSFNSGDFDLSAEDMEELQPITPVVSKVDSDRKLMPPPALPSKILRVQPVHLPREPKGAPVVSPIYCSASLTAHRQVHADFTMTELEGFVDDDLQLTQAPHG